VKWVDTFTGETGIKKYTRKDIANRTQNAIGAFHELAGQGNISELDFMLQNGMDVNAKNQVGGTALGLGISRRKPQSVQFLLDNKANPNIIYSTP
jgi:ankyrin repeat protein